MPTTETRRVLVDFLDVPLVHLLEPMFLENWPDGFQTPDRVGRRALGSSTGRRHGVLSGPVR